MIAAFIEVVLYLTITLVGVGLLVNFRGMSDRDLAFRRAKSPSTCPDMFLPADIHGKLG